MTGIILRTGEQWEPTATDLDMWQKHFPGIDIHRELLKIAAWNYANPSRRKTERGIRRHIALWLSGCKVDTSTRANSLVHVLKDRSWAQ